MSHLRITNLSHGEEFAFSSLHNCSEISEQRLSPLPVRGRFQCGKVVSEVEGAKDGLMEAMHYWNEVRCASVCTLIKPDFQHPFSSRSSPLLLPWALVSCDAVCAYFANVASCIWRRSCPLNIGYYSHDRPWVLGQALQGWYVEVQNAVSIPWPTGG